jgi:hypothetical protein
MRDIEEIKKMGKMSTRALLYMLETNAGVRIVNLDIRYDTGVFRNGQEYITMYCEFTLRGDVEDPDEGTMSAQISKIGDNVYPLISQFILDSEGKLKKISNRDDFFDHDNVIYFDKCSYDYGDGNNNLFMTYQYTSNIYLENED